MTITQLARANRVKSSPPAMPVVGDRAFFLHKGNLCRGKVTHKSGLSSQRYGVTYTMEGKFLCSSEEVFLSAKQAQIALEEARKRKDDAGS